MKIGSGIKSSDLEKYNLFKHQFWPHRSEDTRGNRMSTRKYSNVKSLSQNINNNEFSDTKIRNEKTLE